jgi:saccharopine dehydrogenase-like NADP-dependent oxidoreductase
MSMKVLVLGGAGDMGRHACRIAVAFGHVEELVVADLAGDAAASFADELGAKAKPRQLDVTDRDALKAAMLNADVVLNTVGPFFRFGVPILTAAIEARCDYLDICDDWAPTLDMLDRHSAARDAAVTAVIGLGASPGVVNLLAILAAAQLDDVRRLLTGWNLDLGQPNPSLDTGSSAAIEHGIEQMTGTVRVLRDG